MHQVSLETICPLKAFQLHYCLDNDAKSMVKHFIFLQKFAVIRNLHAMPYLLAVLAKITHHDYSNKIKDKMARITKR